MQKQAWKRMFAQPVWLLAGGVAVLLLLAFGLLLYSSWRHDMQLRPIQRHLGYVAAIEVMDDDLRGLAVKFMTPGPDRFDPSQPYILDRQLRELATAGLHLDADTPARIAAAQRHLAGFDGSARRPLDETLGVLRGALAAELTAHGLLMSDSRAMAQRELRITLGILAGLALFAIPLSLLVRQRILVPLDNLGYLMTLLSRHGYTSAAVQGVDPMLRPLFVNYNRMVGRLVELEQAHQQREETLTDSVRRATRLLLQQQRRLARAERLGAIGEVTASVAHELRNPLTSVHMALQNLRGDLQDPDHAERVDMMIGEIRRLSQHLTILLDGARQVPEALTAVDLPEMLRDLIALVGYQLSERIRVGLDAPEHCVCRLPETQFRQCILNLLINAGQALDERGGRIDVCLRAEARRLRLLVEDDGPGFPEPILAAGARPFGSWRTGGTGLGLMMVRRFVGDLGGQMHLENRAPNGARVTLDIPCGSPSDG